MMLSRKIKLNLNEEQKRYVAQAIGIARFTYNWIVEQFNKNLENNVWVNPLELKKEFNKIKRENFPFVLEVSKYVSQQPFIYFNKALTNFRKGTGGPPQFQKKKHKSGSFYIGGDQVSLEYSYDGKRCYLKIPKLSRIRMREIPTLVGHINSVVISRSLDDYYVSISYEIEDYKKERISNGSVGIDLGLIYFFASSDRVLIMAFKSFLKNIERLIKAQRKLSKKQHPRSKDDVKAGITQSNNYIKQKELVAKIHRDVVNSRDDFLHKLSTHLVKHYQYIAIETLDVKGLLEEKKLSKSIADASWSKFISILKYKAEIYGNTIIEADKYLPSTKTCSGCGEVKAFMNLNDRVYECDKCGLKINRDYNASLNLLSYMKTKIGKALPELTPVEMQEMLSNLKKNNLSYSIVESGINAFSLETVVL